MTLVFGRYRTAIVDGKKVEAVEPIGPSVYEHLAAHLTERQVTVVRALVESLDQSEVAEGLGVSLSTVELYWRDIRGALGLGHLSKGASRVALVRLVYGIDPCFCR